MSSSPPSKASVQAERDKCEASPTGVASPAAAQDQHQATDIPLDMISAARRKVRDIRYTDKLATARPGGLYNPELRGTGICGSFVTNAPVDLLVPGSENPAVLRSSLSSSLHIAYRTVSKGPLSRGTPSIK